ncbi:hypothetical protein OAD49_02690 [Flavobacteriaceae bacterium]|nr:hypothetical protein [Flavobacteriaceae bacterium]
MKKLITLALIIGATTLTQAQSNLVFNQVLILDFTNNAAEPYIVPEGKVWKVESGASGSTFKVDGNTWTMGDLGSYRMGPIWIPENSALIGGAGDADFISVLEFNVVPISTTTGDSGGGVSADGFTASGIINLAFSGTNSSGNIGTKTVLGTITVPEGKIWKIISSSFGNSSNPDTVYLGNGYNGDIFVDDFIVSGEDRPVYLTAGSYEVAGKTAASGGGGIYYILGKIGGIEYNDN